ncbi:hypothetical protein [Natrarchaeobaculum sulfurireducens]|nr:hypothetical protein [Natrarchaeobaculum sulfurireducens]
MVVTVRKTLTFFLSFVLVISVVAVGVLVYFALVDVILEATT